MESIDVERGVLHELTEQLIDNLMAVGQIEFRLGDVAMAGIACGILACLVSPAWSLGALVEVGVSPEQVANRIRDMREWLESHPVAIEEPAHA